MRRSRARYACPAQRLLAPTNPPCPPSNTTLTVRLAIVLVIMPTNHRVEEFPRPVIAPQDVAQLGPPVAEPRLDGTRRYSNDFGDLAVGIPMDIAEDHAQMLIVRKLGEGNYEAPAKLTPLREGHRVIHRGAGRPARRHLNRKRIQRFRRAA